MVLDKLGKGINNFFDSINKNSYIIGIAMIFVNIGSKFLAQELSESNTLFNNKIVRRITIFTIIFIATKDIKVSLILTAVFIIFALNLFNGKSKFCILPKSMRKYDLNKDNKLSPYEIEQAYLDLKKKNLLPSQISKKMIN